MNSEWTSLLPMLGNERRVTPLEAFYLILPILVSFSVLTHLASTCRKLGQEWKALQLYDLQEINEEEKSKAQLKVKPSESELGQLALILFILIVPGVLYLASSNTESSSIASARELLINLYLALGGLPFIDSIITGSTGTLFLGRDKRGGSTIFEDSDFKSKSEKSSVVVPRILVPALYVSLAVKIPIETLLIPSIFGILMGRRAISQVLSFSFKLLAIPMLCLCGVGVFFLFKVSLNKAATSNEAPGLDFLNEQAYLKGFEKGRADAAGGILADTVSDPRRCIFESHRSLSMEDYPKEDLSLYGKFDYLLKPYYWILMTLIPTWFIVLAYRYESGKTSTLIDSQKALPTAEELTEVIQVKILYGMEVPAVVLSKFDAQGKRPVNLSSISIPRLSTPIYKAALLTLLAAHLLAVVVEFSRPVDLNLASSYWGKSPSFLAMRSSAATSVSLVAGIFLPLVMMITAYFTEGGFWKFWNYNGKWELDVPETETEFREKGDLRLGEKSSTLA